MDEGDILVNEGEQLGTVGDDLPVGEDVRGTVQGAEALLALQVPGDEHAGGQLGTGNLAAVDKAVADVRRAVRRDEAEVSRRVAGQGENAEPCAADIDVVVLREDNAVGCEALLQKNFAALAVGQGDIVGAVAVGVDGDARLDERNSGLRAVFLLQIPHIARVVKVCVGAQHGADAPALRLDEPREGGAIQLGVARVHEDDLAVIQFIYGQQGGGSHRSTGAAADRQKLHGIPPMYDIFPIIHRRTEKTKFFSFAPYAKREK